MFSEPRGREIRNRPLIQELDGGTKVMNYIINPLLEERPSTMRQSSYEDKHLLNRNYEEILPNTAKVTKEVLGRKVELDRASFISTRIDLCDETQNLLPDYIKNGSAPRSMDTIIEESTAITVPYDPSNMPAVIM